LSTLIKQYRKLAELDKDAEQDLILSKLVNFLDPLYISVLPQVVYGTDWAINTSYYYISTADAAGAITAGEFIANLGAIPLDLYHVTEFYALYDVTNVLAAAGDIVLYVHDDVDATTWDNVETFAGVITTSAASGKIATCTLTTPYQLDHFARLLWKVRIATAQQNNANDIKLGCFVFKLELIQKVKGYQ